jgi:hypothetical protein
MLTRLQFETARSDMIDFATMMASRNKHLRKLSPMQRDIFRHRRLYNIFFFLKSILLISRFLRFQLTTIWPNMTNNPTMVACRKKT